MKIKRTQKGFTLIELLIVLAVFSIILMLVMSFIDPVSRLMTKTSTKERTASYVDNIGDYLDKSLRYAKFVRVYEGDYGDREDITNLPVITEEDAVKAFVDDFFDGALGSDNHALKGKVHVLKLYNDNMPGSNDKPGVAYECEYSFVAGDSCPISHDFATGNPDDPTETETKTGRVFDGDTTVLKYGEDVFPISCPTTGSFPKATITKETTDQMVLNREHFVDYSYYYILGYYELEPITPSELADYEDLSGDPIPTSEKYYYSRLTQMKENSTSSNMTVGADKFALNVVAYQNNAKGVNMLDAMFNGGATPAPVSIFKSPSYISATSMSLKNCVAAGMKDSTLYEKYFRLSQTTFTGTGTVSVNKDSEGKDLLEAIDPKDYWGETFEDIRTKDVNSAVTSNNIYIIYALPDEVSPSKIVYN